MTVFLTWRISKDLWTLSSGQGQSFLSCIMPRGGGGGFSDMFIRT